MTSVLPAVVGGTDLIQAALPQTGIGAVKYSPNVDDSEVYIVGGLLIGAGAGAIGGMLFGQSKRNRTMVYDAR